MRKETQILTSLFVALLVSVVSLSPAMALGSSLAAETPSTETENRPDPENAVIEPSPQQPPTMTSDDWQVSVTPYLWMTNLSGTNTIGPITAPIEIDFSDLIDRLKFAFAAHFEVSKKNWGGMFDFNYAAIGDNQVLTTPLGETADFNFDIFYLDLWGFYRIPGERQSFDILAGTRYRKLELDLRFTTGLNPGFDVSWWDPMIGGRYIAKLHPSKLDFQFRADVGGFGAGSEHTWEIITGVIFKPTPKILIPVLYRYLDVDYMEGSGLDFFRYDAVEQGLLLGIGFHF